MKRDSWIQLKNEQKYFNDSMFYGIIFKGDLEKRRIEVNRKLLIMEGEDPDSEIPF